MYNNTPHCRLKLQPLIKTIVQLVIDGDLNRDVESLRKLYPTADYEQLKHIAIEERSQNSLFSSEEYRDDLMMGTETEFLRCIASVGGNSSTIRMAWHKFSTLTHHFINIVSSYFRIRTIEV